MKKFLLLLFILPFVACSDDEDSKNNKDVDMIYNEPLLVFDKQLNDVKNAETRVLIFESNDALTYNDKKGDINYTITYSFTNSKLYSVQCIFGYSENIFLQLTEDINSKYKKKSNDVTHISDDEKYAIWISNEIGTNEIHVTYLKR